MTASRPVIHSFFLLPTSCLICRNYSRAKQARKANQVPAYLKPQESPVRNIYLLNNALLNWRIFHDGSFKSSRQAREIEMLLIGKIIMWGSDLQLHQFYSFRWK